ncbi:MAG: phosphoenolpyruvate--protein phosphotransferase [Planctomycetes bacterium]|nr:phosphoenolpyruvate--protein phosphotransferase [Planctomycetota bacterium]
MAKEGKDGGSRRGGTDSWRRDAKRHSGEHRPAKPSDAESPTDEPTRGRRDTRSHRTPTEGLSESGSQRKGSDSQARLRHDAQPGSDSYNRRRKSSFRGIPVVAGIAIGHARIKFRRTQVLSDRPIAADDVVKEEERLAEAVRLSKVQLLESRAKVAAEVGEVEAMIFDAHLAILEDQTFLRKVRNQVAKELRPVEVVVATTVEGYYRAISQIQDVHLRERAADIRDVGRRLLDNLEKLTSPKERSQTETEGDVDEIICAHELLPSDLVALEHRRSQAILCELGSDRGHAAIMLRAMNMPSVMGVVGLIESVQDGDLIIVDGSSGVVYVNPKKEIVDSYRKTQREFEQYKQVLSSEVALPAVTTDGFAVQLLANVSKHAEIDLAKRYNIDGVGLYRTEFHLMVGTSYPDEEEQYWIYREAVERMGGKPVTLRTMDIGSDKKLPYVKMADDDAHVLGRRSIRLMSELEEYQLIQLRAILRASAHGPVKLMFPFITSLEDIRLAKRLVRNARRELDDRGTAYDQDIPIGMMVEVPAAALSLDKYVREVQFFSVGTNDLTQYVCAADRNHPDVAPWFKSHNPGMLWLMKHVVETAKASGTELTVCGEMAGDPFYTMFLLGIGADRLSMAAPQVPLVKKIVRSVNLTGAQNLAKRALQLTSTGQIRELFATTVQQILGRDLSSWSLGGEDAGPGALTPK